MNSVAPGAVASRARGTSAEVGCGLFIDGGCALLGGAGVVERKFESQRACFQAGATQFTCARSDQALSLPIIGTSAVCVDLMGEGAR